MLSGCFGWWVLCLLTIRETERSSYIARNGDCDINKVFSITGLRIRRHSARHIKGARGRQGNKEHSSISEGDSML